jgi:glycosyltransferase involved in cell wall biosynthesis
VAARPFRAYLLSLSAIPDDPRVRRMGDALAARGWMVEAVGLPGGRGNPPAWPVHVAHWEPPPHPGLPPAAPLLAPVERWCGRMVAASLGPGEAMLRAAGSPYAQFLADVRSKIPKLERPLVSLGRAVRRRAGQMIADAKLRPDALALARLDRRMPQLPSMRAIVEAAPGPALWIANDWMMLPVAEAGRAARGGAVVYDSHELATEEYAELAEWRRFVRPLVRAIEGRFIAKASAVSSVSPGITAHLQRLYNVPAPHFTLLNAPAFAPTTFRATGADVRLLYHGVVAAGRGLEACIDAVPLLDPRFTLTIRGPTGEAGYLDSLKTRAAAGGAGARISFAPPVPMTQLVDAARPFDIGLMALPGHSLHADYALPNKLFEYLMAGLALAVTDLKEMGALIRTTGAGVTLPSLDPPTIAGALNALSTDRIDSLRRAALEAAKTHNFDAQAGPVLDAYERVMEAA